MDLIVYGSERLFIEALAALLTRRGHSVLAHSAELDALIRHLHLREIDVCLVDVDVSFDATIIKQIKSKVPAIPLVALHPEKDPAEIASSIAAGADGVCVRWDVIEEIERVLVRVQARPKDRGIAPIWSQSAKAAGQRPNARPIGAQLTPKEKAVLDLLIPGTPTSQIAREIGISVETVRTHLQNLFRKFEVHSRIALIAEAIGSTGAIRNEHELAL